MAGCTCSCPAMSTYARHCLRRCRSFLNCQPPNVGRCPTPRTRRREARGAVLAGCALVLPPLVRLWPLLSRQGFAPSGPCPRCAAGRASQPGPLRALDPPAADTARKPGNGPTARFLAQPLPDVPPRPKNAATGRFSLLTAVWLSGCWSGRAVKGGGGGWRGPQRSEDTGHPRKAQRPLTDLERPTLPAGVKERRAAGPYALHP